MSSRSPLPDRPVMAAPARAVDSADVGRLAALPVEALRALWAARVGRGPPPSQKALLVRELAWRAQERVSGGPDPLTRRLLADAVRATRPGPPTEEPAEPAGADRPPQRGTRGRRGPAAPLPPAARLVRTWGGTAHEVLVLEGGKSFRYRGKDWASLSEIAREITGARWSGPRFFGLVDRRKGAGATDAKIPAPPRQGRTPKGAAA